MSEQRTVSPTARRWVWGNPPAIRATAPVAMQAEIHQRRLTGVLKMRALMSVTRMILTARSGVATETSPRVRAAKVKIWPTKKSAPHNRGFHNGALAMSGRSKNQTGWTTSAIRRLAKTFTWLAVAPRSMALLRKSEPAA